MLIIVTVVFGWHNRIFGARLSEVEFNGVYHGV